MQQSMSETSYYKRATFVTHLPVGCLYSPTHCWLREITPGVWRVGFTKFATRMLGEMVEVRFEKNTGDPVEAGEIVGSIEGFKAISDIYSCAEGHFGEGNPTALAGAEIVGEKPYDAGWLYTIQGTPDARCFDVEAYRNLLDATIDRMLAKEHNVQG